MSFGIRHFEKDDFETLWTIDQACFEPQIAYSRPELAAYMRRRSAFTLVAQATAKGRPQEQTSQDPAVPGDAGSPTAGILGFIVAEKKRQRGHIITIDVVDQARRLGVGSALLAAAEHQFRLNGTVAVELETAVNNEAAIRFYKKKGYFVERTISAYYANGLDALVMEKPLAAEIDPETDRPGKR